jgi:hypothetical protein
MSQGMVKLNKAKCLICGDVLISKDVNKLETCSCGQFSISGGKHFIMRKGLEGKYREMSQMIDISDLNPNENIGSAPPKQ